MVASNTSSSADVHDKHITRWLAQQICRTCCVEAGGFSAVCVGYASPLVYNAKCLNCRVYRKFDGFGMPVVDYTKGVTTLPHPKWHA